MKKILMAAVALTALSATPAFASDTSNYTVQGTVSNQCGGLSASGGTIDFGTITPAANGTVSVTTPTSAPAAVTVYCNSGTGKVTYSGSTITRSGGSETLSYTPVVTLDGNAVASGGSVGSGGSLLVSASNLTSGSAVAKAGAYTGTLTVTLSPL